MLIGTSGVGRTFTKEVVEAMASLNKVTLSCQCILVSKDLYSPLLLHEISVPMFIKIVTCRDLLFLPFQTRLHNLNALQKKRTLGVRYTFILSNILLVSLH